MSNPEVCVCNMCGRDFDLFDMQEDFGFRYHVGYGSKHDGEYIEAHFCCECFDKLVGVINALSVHPVLEEVNH